MSDDDKDIIEEVEETEDGVEENATEEPAEKPASSAATSTEDSKLYVGNLPFSVDNARLGEIFSSIDGVEVVEAVIITDKFNEGRSKGFGFVTVANAEQANKAIEAMNGSDLDGRKIVVNVARPKTDRADRDNDRGGFRRSY